MTYLVTQTFILLLIAALLGLILGWYLTRIAAATSRASLQSRLHNLEREGANLRNELNASSARVTELEGARKSALDENAALKAQLDSAGTSGQNDDRVAALEGELASCREALAKSSASGDASSAPPPASRAASGAGTGASAGESDEIPSVSRAAAAAAEAAGMPDGAVAPAASGGGEPDDLQRIKGIGPKIEDKLRELGIERFEQIAGWTPENIEWINQHLKFKGRVEREEWIPQAKALARDR